MSQNNYINKILENRDQNQTIQQTITMYLENQNKIMRNEGYIDTNKAPLNIRILLINVLGFKPSNEEKIKMMIESCGSMSIDIMLLNETNTKWTPWNQDKIKQKL